MLKHDQRRTITAITVLLPFFVLALSGQQIKTGRKAFFVSPDGRQVVLQGTWHRTSRRPSVEVRVRIECDRAAGTCNEYLAKFIQKTDDPLGTVGRPYLFLMKGQFRIIEWSRAKIIARSQPPAVDLELNINLTAKTAGRSSEETAARGAKGADSRNLSEWVLE